MTGLVDYDSSSSERVEEEGDVAGAPAKRRKTTAAQDGQQKQLPPLPSAFHDLYASTVRVSTTDDPTLHQGRKRVNPHKPGNWPSHLYIEWHPTPHQRALLESLFADLRESIKADEWSRAGQPIGAPRPLTISLLTSDLGAPLPLHISLSRPIVLDTPRKDEFLEHLVAAVGGGGSDGKGKGKGKGEGKKSSRGGGTGGGVVRPFELVPSGLAWHRSPDSARSFFVMRVVSTAAAAAAAAEAAGRGAVAGDGSRDKGGGGTRRDGDDGSGDGLPGGDDDGNTNPELTTLLGICNDVVTSYDQPPLYAAAPSSSSSSSSSTRGVGDATQAERDDTSQRVQDAFHVSLAWDGRLVTPGLQQVTDSVFDSPCRDVPIPRSSSLSSSSSTAPPAAAASEAEKEEGEEEGRGGATTARRSSRRRRPPPQAPAQQPQQAPPRPPQQPQQPHVQQPQAPRGPPPPSYRARMLDELRIPVDGIKVKIGNVVTHVPLPGATSYARGS